MRLSLQKIELHNFKTYRGNVKVGPLKEFTAVVGPNGSGKSNLLDALSFVLGEDITKLRVKDASQLIHGAHIGRPVAGEASVSASFSSEDGDLYVFKRVISKNSVKHIFNEQNVSKKVYLNELENIGINMQAKNFLVYQGQIEEVAVMDSKQRSHLIEQISGSIQFKREYDECKKAMVVAADKIHMVFKKQRSCRNELKEARLERADLVKYDQLQDELALQTLKLQLFKLFHNERGIENLQEKIVSKKSELEGLNERQGEAEENLKECNRSLRKRGRELTRLQMEVQEQEAEVQKRQEPLIKAREEVLHMSSKLEQAQDTLQKAHEADKNHKRNLRDLRKELAAVERELQEYQQTVAEESLSQGRSIELEQSQAAQYNDLKVEAAKRSSSYQQKMETLNREQKADQDQLEDKQRKLNDIEAGIKQKEDEKSEEIKRSTRLLKSIESTEADFEALNCKQQALNVNSKLYEEKIVSVQKELEHINHRIGDAKYDSYEKDSQQKRQKAIQALKRHFPGVFDRLVNVCDPIHPKYSIALTKVMGKRLNAIVVDKEETAIRCIEYLKANLMGPEEFLPVKYLKVKPLTERLRSIKNPKGCKLLFDVVLYEPPEVKNAVLFATKSVVVCETADDAQYVAYETYHDKIIDAVSLDGSYFQANGFISGGKADLAKKAREWDEKDIVQMKARKTELLEELRDVQKKSRCASEVQCVKQEVKVCNARLEVMKKDYENSLKKISACDEFLEKLRAHYQGLEPELRKIEGVLREREMTINKLQRKLCSIEDEVFASFCERINVSNIREYEESGLRSYEERAKKSLEFEDRKNRIQNQIEYEMGVDTHSNINRWMAEVDQRKTALASSAEALEHHKQIVATAEEKLKQHQDVLDQKKKEQDVLVKNSDEAQHEVRQMVEKVAQVSKQLLEIETECESLKRARHTVLLQCKVDNIDIPPPGCLDSLADGNTMLSTESSTSNTLDSQSLYERILDIEIDYNLLDGSLKDLQNVAEVKEREMQLISDISKTSKKLEALSTPNLNNQRSEDKVESTSVKLKETQVEFKANQSEGKKIKDRFERIKKERYDMFMDCFNFVSNEIDTVFKDLTQSTSASAMVIAEDPEEPYLAGIQYSCIAPGKSCKHMEDLSGGEKTLASIAFILTLHKYRKAPCLVLDEVDAALDNINISKIANHFSSNKAEIQTVAISLNQEFYSHADALIGVTREGAQKPSEIFYFNLEDFPK